MKQPDAESDTGDFEFKALAEARNYRRTMVKEFAPFLKGRILEVGAGIGQTSEEILSLANVDSLTGLEPDARFHEEFRERLPGVRLLGGTTADLDKAESFDGAVMVNVLEHIGDDEDELARLREILATREGHLCLLVPARQEIYSRIDAHFGHFRRYSRTELRTKLETAGFQIKHLSYFNFVGYFAWALRFRMLGSLSFDIDQVRFFDRRIFPVAHWLESRICRPPIGQSVIAVAQSR